MGEKEYSFKIKDVIEKMIAKEGVSLQVFADTHEIPVDTLKNILYKDLKDPRASTVIMLSEALGLTPYQLLGYESTRVELLLDHYFQCGDGGKDLIDYVAEEQAMKYRANKNKGYHEIPCLYPVSHLEDGIVISTGKTKLIKVTDEKAFGGYEINTDNFMEEHFFEGDIILIERRRPEKGEMCVVSDGTTAYFRIFEESDKEEYHYKLTSMNPKGEDFYVDSLRTPFMCNGTYLNVIRKKDKK